MLRIAKWTSPLLAFGLVVALVCANVRAEDKKDTGTVSGTVVDKDGKAVSGAKVSLFHQGDRGNKDTAKHEEKKEKELAEGDKPADKPKDKPQPVATATTDDAGKFTLSDVPAGAYKVQARLKGVGAGGEKVEVKSGETTEVKLTLAEGQGKKK